NLEEQVEGNQRPVVEGGEGQLLGEAAQALDLDAVEEDQDEHAQGQAEGAVRVGGRHDLEGRHASQVSQTRDVVDRDPLQAVHQEDPDEDGQGQRGDQRIATVEGVLDDALHEVDGHFDQVLQAARNAFGGAGGSQAEQQDEQQAHGQGPAHGIQMDGHEAHVAGFRGALGDGPGGLVDNAAVGPRVTRRQLAVGQVLQVV